jgi:hypothetical protein
MWEAETVAEAGGQRGRVVVLGSVDIFADEWLVTSCVLTLSAEFLPDLSNLSARRYFLYIRDIPGWTKKRIASSAISFSRGC